MGLLRNKKGVEGLPLKYVIIALVAVVVIGMALYVTDSLGTSVKGATDKIGDTLTERTTCELDDEAPEILSLGVVCDASTNMISVTVRLLDECGIDRVSFDINDDDSWISLDLNNGTIHDGYWNKEDYNYTEAGGFGTEIKIEISAFDKAATENWGYLAETITCD